MEDTRNRKGDHLRICIEEDVNQRVSNGLERYRFHHCCLPEIDFDDIDLSCQFLGKTLGMPLLISSMTGGTDRAKLINLRLAEIASRHGLAMGVGSQRVAVENPEVEDSFKLRSLAPDAFLMANLGAVQLNYSYGIEQCLKVIDILEADALILHLNPLQECIQTRGDKNFSKLLDKIDKLCSKLAIPVVIKEVGNGISGKMAKLLIEAGASAIDVAGAGGTSWAKVESERADNELQRQLGRTFADWGIPTAECILEVRGIDTEIPLIASGGIKNGLEAAKCLALGADLVGLAMPFLKAADRSAESLNTLVELLRKELETTLFCTGNGTIGALKQSRAIEKIG